jgi:hypothetical protein
MPLRSQFAPLALVESAVADRSEQRWREQDVWIRRDDEGRSRPSYADILCSKYAKWNLIGLVEAAYRSLPRNSDDSHRKRATGVRTAEDLGERRLAWKRAPLDEDHVSSNTLPTAREPGDIPQKTGCASEEIAAVLFVPQGRNKLRSRPCAPTCLSTWLISPQGASSDPHCSKPSPVFRASRKSLGG